MSQQIEVFRTMRAYEADIVADNLSSLGIPYHRREQSVTEGSEAIPPLPSPAPGAWFVISVPRDAVDYARAAIAELPLSPTDEKTSPEWAAVRPHWIYRAYSIILIVLVVVGTLAAILSWLRLAR